MVPAPVVEARALRAVPPSVREGRAVVKKEGDPVEEIGLEHVQPPRALKPCVRLQDDRTHVAAGDGHVGPEAHERLEREVRDRVERRVLRDAQHAAFLVTAARRMEVEPAAVLHARAGDGIVHAVARRRGVRVGGQVARHRRRFVVVVVGGVVDRARVRGVGGRHAVRHVHARRRARERRLFLEPVPHHGLRLRGADRQGRRHKSDYGSSHLFRAPSCNSKWRYLITLMPCPAR